MGNVKKYLISVLAVVIVSWLMLYTESKSDGEAGIIVKLELAPTIETVKHLLAPFDEEHISWLRVNTELDFLFIITYSALFFFALKGLLEGWGKTNQWKVFLPLAFAAGVLDVIENLFILNFLNRDFSTPFFSIYYIVVHLKWGLVAVFVLLSLIYLATLIREKVAKA